MPYSIDLERVPTELAARFVADYPTSQAAHTIFKKIEHFHQMMLLVGSPQLGATGTETFPDELIERVRILGYDFSDPSFATYHPT